MSGTPVAGYPNKKAACLAFIAEGLDDEEIIRRVGTTKMTIDVYRSLYRRSQRRPGVVLDEEDLLRRRAKAIRIYQTFLVMLSEAVNLGPVALHNTFRTIRNETLIKEPAQSPDGQNIGGGELGDKAAPADAMLTNPPIPDGRENEHGTEVPVTSSSSTEQNDGSSHAEESDVLQMRPKTSASFDERVSAGLVTLRNVRTGEWLHYSGEKLTTERQYAYSGTIMQAKKMRLASDAAKGLSITRFEPKGAT